MRFRAGVVIGFGAGYYLGSKAGRERYEQIRDALARARRSRPIRKAKAVAEIGLERLRSRPDETDESEVVVAEGYAQPAFDEPVSPN